MYSITVAWPQIISSLFSAILNTAFYFSVISNQEKKNGSINEESKDSDIEDHEPSPVPSTFSKQLLDGNPTRVNKSGQQSHTGWHSQHLMVPQLIHLWYIMLCWNVEWLSWQIRYNRGKVYKKMRGQSTPTRTSVNQECLLILVTNKHFKSRLIQDMRKVIELLSDPHCELFQPLVINYDLIEVKDGICWSIKNRSFVESPIEERQGGRVSTRAFCAYDPEKRAGP